jgi:hypothetical protein
MIPEPVHDNDVVLSTQDLVGTVDISQVNTASNKATMKENFCIPIDQENMTLLQPKLIKVGFLKAQAQSIINVRKIMFNKAMRDFKKEIEDKINVRKRCPNITVLTNIQ